MRVQAEVGHVPQDTEPNYVDPQSSDPNAAETIAMANSVGETMKEADEAVAKAKGSKASTGFLGLLFLILGASAVLGFRAWANRTVPMPDFDKPTKW